MQKGFRTIGPQALDNYVGTDVIFHNRHGILADRVPNSATIINDVPDSDFYIRMNGFYVPLRHGDSIRLRQDSSKPHSCCVRDYVFIDESD